VDFGEGFGKVIGRGFGGGERLLSGLDRDGALAACGPHEFLDAPTCLGLDPVADGQGGEHDGHVGVDGVAGAVVDGAGGQVVLGHPERLLDAPQLVVGADGEVSGLAGQVGSVALPARPDFYQASAHWWRRGSWRVLAAFLMWSANHLASTSLIFIRRIARLYLLWNVGSYP
jgi:hypothetical protein